MVDNAFASPALQRPMEFGAHIVVHSSTKYIDGQGRALGGVICCTEDFLHEASAALIRNTGPSISPFNAWLHLKSLETLDLRMRQHCENAAKVADFLADQRKVTRVLYPFRADHPQHNLARAQMEAGGGIVAFEIEGGKKAAFKLSNALGTDRHLQQSGRRQEPDHPSRDHHPFQAVAGGARRTGRHRRACCAFRSASKTPTIFAKTWSRRSRRPKSPRRSLTRRASGFGTGRRSAARCWCRGDRKRASCP